MKSLAVLTFACGVLASGCGYHAVHGGGETRPPLHVVLAHAEVADGECAEATLLGVREALASHGLLAPGTGYPRVEVDVLRIDHAPGAIGAGAQPRAVQLRVSVLGRARVAIAAGEIAEDTGDLRGGTGYAPQSGGSEVLADADATRAAGRRLGRMLGERILGIPVVSEDPL